jgi:hypothetical protein
VKGLSLVIVVAGIFALATGAVGAPSASAASPAQAVTAFQSVGLAHCPNYQNSPNCVVVPPSGIVNITICGVHFVGTAAPGTTIECSNLPLLVRLPCASSTSLPQTGGAVRLDPSVRNVESAAEACCQSGVSLSIHGTGLHLKVPGGRIYKFDPATGLSHRVSAITGSGGEYTILYGSCSATFLPLPKTGGGDVSILSRTNVTNPGPRPGVPVLPIGIGTLLVLAGSAALFTRTKAIQSLHTFRTTRS